MTDPICNQGHLVALGGARPLFADAEAYFQFKFTLILFGVMLLWVTEHKDESLSLVE
jgi:hypothetical protein